MKSKQKILKKFCKGLAIVMVGQRRNAPVSSSLEKIIFKTINIGKKTQPLNIQYLPGKRGPVI